MIEARDGVDALAELAGPNPEPDLILTDVILPRMGGFALAEEVHRTRPHIRILFMSRFSEGKNPKGKQPEGAFHLLQKPFTSQALLASVEQALIAGSVHGGA